MGGFNGPRHEFSPHFLTLLELPVLLSGDGALARLRRASFVG